MAAQEGKAEPCPHGLESLRGVADLLESIARRWKEYFKDLLNPTNIYSKDEAEPGDFKLGSLITLDEVAGAVKHLCSGSALGVDEIQPKLLKALDVVGQ